MENMQFICDWTSCLLRKVNELPTGCKNEMKHALEECSGLCFERNQFSQKLKRYKSPEEFIESFCIPVLGWECEYDPKTGVIVCRENNEQCLCPIVKAMPNISDIICCCTQGEIKRIFRYALGADAEVSIVDSWVKNEKSCVYEVKLK